MKVDLKTLESSTTDELSKMSERIESSLEKLNEYCANNETAKTENINLLAKKAQLKKGYSELDK